MKDIVLLHIMNSAYVCVHVYWCVVTCLIQCFVFVGMHTWMMCFYAFTYFNVMFLFAHIPHISVCVLCV